MKGSFQTQLADENLTNRDTRNEGVVIKVDFTAGSAAYTTGNLFTAYTARAGKIGKTK